MNAIQEFKKRYREVRSKGWLNPFEAFVYALNGWMLLIWYGAFAVLGWFLLDIIQYGRYL